MAGLLKLSTLVTIRLGPFLDKTTGVDEETAITPVVEVSKNHGAFGARSSATAIAHDSNGWYSVELNTTDTGTLGPFIAKADDAATHLPVWREFLVVPAAVFDALVAGTGNGVRADVQAIVANAITAAAIATDAITAAKIASAAITAAKFGAGAIDAAAIAADAITAAKIAAGAIDAAAIGASAIAATKIADGALTAAKFQACMVRGTVGASATTTSIPTSSLDPAVTVADQLVGRVVVFDRATTTAALRGQATSITANTSGGTLTVVALTTSPVSGDLFTVV